MGPMTDVGEATHAMKYRARSEDFRAAVNRISSALNDNNSHYHSLRHILGTQRFMPAGRIQSAAGSTKSTTMYNCFVSGVIDDSYTDDEDTTVANSKSIMGRAHQAAITMRMGGGIGYDFSTLRPRGELIRKLGSSASGPVSFMDIYNGVCLATSSSGHRRGAQMAVLRIDHPDIEEFIYAKQNPDRLTGFNVSIAVTDAFMEALYAKKTFDLRWGGQTYKTVDAEALWETVMRSTWDWAEPGVIFIDTVNKMNNLNYCETIAATNPCGEQPLPPHGACLLGSFNLVKYLRPAGPNVTDLLSGTASKWTFDWDQLIADMPHVVRAMDNVVDRSRYPLLAQKVEATDKRRMGLGVTGLANAAEALGYPYGSQFFTTFEGKVLETIRDESYRASVELAKEKGAFPEFNADKYLAGKFIQTLPEDIQDGIRRYGIRNSHLTSIAPTGTISLAADNVSSSIEPVFAGTVERPVNTPDGQRIMTVEDYGQRFLDTVGRPAAEITAAEHVAVLTTAQRYVDSAVSKTCNVDAGMEWADFKNIYVSAYNEGAKGCTTFNQNGKRMALLTAKPTMQEPASEDSCRIDPTTGRRECA